MSSFFGLLAAFAGLPPHRPLYTYPTHAETGYLYLYCPKRLFQNPLRRPEGERTAAVRGDQGGSLEHALWRRSRQFGRCKERSRRRMRRIRRGWGTQQRGRAAVRSQDGVL